MNWDNFDENLTVYDEVEKVDFFVNFKIAKNLDMQKRTFDSVWAKESEENNLALRPYSSEVIVWFSMPVQI